MYRCNECGYVGVEEMGSHCPNCDARPKAMEHIRKRTWDKPKVQDEVPCNLCGAPSDNGICEPCLRSERNV